MKLNHYRGKWVTGIDRRRPVTECLGTPNLITVCGFRLIQVYFI